VLRLRAAVDDALKHTFRPEFLNRIDEIIVFHPLAEEDIKRIVNLLVERVATQLGERHMRIDLTDAAKAHLAQVGYDPTYGARPLRRAIQRSVENPLAKMLLKGEAHEGDTVRVDAVGDGLTFEVVAKAEAAT
jgi:ATP-dependent Clp protease ATP-binding subunit ClpC